MRGSAAFRTAIAPGGVLAGPWVKNPLWRTARAVPSLDLQFADNKSLTDAVTGQSLVTFTRASSGTYVDSTGTIRTATTNEPRFDHNPTTGESLGLLVEEQRTNSIRNNTMVGAVAGTPGTLPTNWSESLAGLTREVVGVGTQNGISYIDIRLSGTSTGTQAVLRWDATFAAADGQSWAHSLWVARTAGSLPSGNIVLSGNLFNASSVYVGDTTAVQIKSLIGTSLARLGGVNTIAIATTASIRPYIYFLMANGEAVDFTLRIGLPQLELGAFATSVIPTTTAAATRSADVASISGSNFSGWYRQDEQTWLGEYAPIYNASATVPSGTPHLFQVYTLAAANNLYSIRGAGAGTSQETFGRNPTVGLLFVNNTGVGYGTAGSYRKVAMGINPATIAAVTNNSAVASQSNTVAALMAVHDFMAIGTGTTGGIPQQVNGHIKRLTHWPARLGNEVLQRITQ